MNENESTCGVWLVVFFGVAITGMGLILLAFRYEILGIITMLCGLMVAVVAGMVIPLYRDAKTAERIRKKYNHN